MYLELFCTILWSISTILWNFIWRFLYFKIYYSKINIYWDLFILRVKNTSKFDSLIGFTVLFQFLFSKDFVIPSNESKNWP